jgi:hypothetical protein
MSRQPCSPSATANLNNDAALQMYTGNYSQAAETLSYALKTIKQAKGGLQSCNKHHPPYITSEPTTIYVAFDCTFSDDALVSCQRSRHILLAANRNSSLCLDEFFLYKHPVQVFTTSDDTPDELVEVVLSYAIIYNLALCHHLRAISENTPSIHEGIVKRAIALYKHAQKLLTSHSTKLDVLHTLAILNNLGHAYHLLHKEATAKVCFWRLLKAIMRISDNDQSHPRLQTRNRLPLAGFLSNVMSLLMVSSSGAPAA